MGARSVLILAELTDGERSVVEQDCENCNFDVKWVTSPEMVGTKLISGKFDALVVDLRTPGAARACVEARKALARVRFPIMAMEDVANDTTFTKAFRVGADDVIQMSASAQISQRLAAIPKPSWKRPERSRGEALIIDPDRARAEALGRLLKEVGYLVKSVRDEAASRIHRGRESVRLVIVEASDEATKLIRDGNRREWQPLWIVRTRPDQLDQVSRELAEFHNASAVNGFLAAGDVLYEANRLAEADSLRDTPPLLLHGTTVRFSAEAGKWSDVGFSYSLGLDALAVRTLALPPGAELEVELVAPGETMPMTLAAQVTERRVFGPLQGRSEPPGFSVTLSGENLSLWQELVQRAYQERHGQKAQASLAPSASSASPGSPISSSPPTSAPSSPPPSSGSREAGVAIGRVKLVSSRTSRSDRPPVTLLGGIGQPNPNNDAPSPSSSEVPTARSLAPAAPSSDSQPPAAAVMSSRGTDATGEAEPPSSDGQSMAVDSPAGQLSNAIDATPSLDVDRPQAELQTAHGTPNTELEGEEQPSPSDSGLERLGPVSSSSGRVLDEPQAAASRKDASSRDFGVTTAPSATAQEAAKPDRDFEAVALQQIAKSSPQLLEPSSPEASSPEPSSPEASSPEPSSPEPSGPEASSPEASGPEASCPEPSSPEPSGPEPSGPEPSSPEQSPPEPGRAKPDRSQRSWPAAQKRPQPSRPVEPTRSPARVFAVVAAVGALAAGIALVAGESPTPTAPSSASAAKPAPQVHALSSSRPTQTTAPSIRETTQRDDPPEPVVRTPTLAAEPVAASPKSHAKAPSAQTPTVAAPASGPTQPTPVATPHVSPPPASLDAKALPGHQGYLYVVSSLDTQVFVQGKLVGKTNTYVPTFCGRRYVRLGSAPGAWQSRGVTFKIGCQQHSRLTLEPAAQSQ